MSETEFTYVNAKSAERVLDILELVTASKDGLSRTEIAERLRIPKSSASILLRSLVARKYLRPDGSGRRLRLGIRAFETGSAFLRQVSLRDIARPLMNELVQEFGQTCHLAVIDGTDVVYLEKVDPPHTAVQLVTFVGSRLPAAWTAVGKAQLAYLPDDDLNQRYGSSPSDRKALRVIRAGRNKIRSRGWASECGETTPGIGCLAAPVFGYVGIPIAAIGATFLEVRASALSASAGPRLREAALEISRLNGFIAAGTNGDGAEHRRMTERRAQ
jgi:DNA-binding IclR family transcriptional regulator